MASTARDIFVVGLRNAHSMEVQARELMERQSERLTDYPEVQAKVRAHLRETEGSSTGWSNACRRWARAPRPSRTRRSR
jgi:ferritin-like metal-binding protein YciE